MSGKETVSYYSYKYNCLHNTLQASGTPGILKAMKHQLVSPRNCSEAAIPIALRIRQPKRKRKLRRVSLEARCQCFLLEDLQLRSRRRSIRGGRDLARKAVRVCSQAATWNKRSKQEFWITRKMEDTINFRLECAILGRE